MKLKCPICGKGLRMSVGYAGCDRDTEAGAKSGYGWEVSLVCSDEHCACRYTIGTVKNLNDFTPMKDQHKCVL